ncbi:hypothetical protein BUALT_Bualt10G0093900 [Buddleja alternifolia]|uniref:Terpene synthase N-terminal domain-containing protein n=1 Tax=Buddleja alternifolia TaxID=168488 RepID=A0AAV6X5J6_9LAMI|nr:hypothetical protein BUALT_Bualt10G0093900 [Buddleja alternifolia]
MVSISMSKPNYSPVNVIHYKIPVSATMNKYLPLPECFTSTRVNRRQQILLNYHVQHKQIATVISVRTRDVSLDESIDDFTAEDGHDKVGLGLAVNKIDDYINDIRSMLSTIEDGRISVSPYNTAWVALIKDIQGRDIPQFPSSLEWIAQNQLPDGSWGDEHVFCAYDRLLNTLACVVALRSWNVHADKSEKGMSFIKKNMCTLEKANAEHMPCGFELVFPALLRRAENLGIEDIPYGAPVMREIYIAKDLKMDRIPNELIHKIHTPLLYSLEGLEDLDWQKLLKLQENDGSFYSSPSSTAFAFMETKDEKCLKFITNIVKKFNGGAPHTYPVDIFARLWAVDRLQRLGISRFFESEIKDCLSYIYRVWTKKGVYSRRDFSDTEIDDTSMGFRLLRLYGYDVNPNVFKTFKKDNGFFCHAGEMIESPTPIYSFYRASQLRFPGEKILEEANNFSYNFLQEKLASNQLLDKWIITKNLPDELRYGLVTPWYANLPRVEARFYIEIYGGAKDVWIAKTMYRMPDISNDAYLELAKLDFNRCQAQHRIEWNNMQEWYVKCKLQKLGISKKDLLFAYFLATATIFEPERSKERNAWVKSQIVSKVITSYFTRETISSEEKVAFLADIIGLNKTNSCSDEQGRIIDILQETLEQLLEGIDVSLCHQLGNARGTWLMKLHEGVANWGEDAELLITTLNICGGHIQSAETLSHHDYNTFSNLINKICHQLFEYQNKKASEQDLFVSVENGCIKYMEIEEDMQRLMELVLKETNSGINSDIKQTFLLVAKAFYYTAYFSAETIELHITKVLFEPVA